MWVVVRHTRGREAEFNIGLKVPRHCPFVLLVSVNKCNYLFFNKATAQPGTDAKVRVFSAGLLARSQFASGRSCDRPARSRFSEVFLDPRANAELVPKFHVALYASHAALPMVTSKFLALTQRVKLRFPFKFNSPPPPPNAIKLKLNLRIVSVARMT
jgi:hypothetical protein